MINLLIGLFIGAFLGFVYGGMCRTAKEADQNIDDGTDGIYFKCSTVGHGECEDMCCWLCPVASECTKQYKCKGNPGTCGHSVLQ